LSYRRIASVEANGDSEIPFKEDLTKNWNAVQIKLLKEGLLASQPGPHEEEPFSPHIPVKGAHSPVHKAGP